MHIDSPLLHFVGIVYQPVQNRVSESGIGQDVVPLAHRHLAGDQRGTGLVAIFDDVKQIPGFLHLERGKTPVVQEQEIGLLELADQGVAAAVAPGGSGGPEEPGGAPVAYRESQAAGLVGQGRGDEILPDPGRPGDDQIVMFPDPPAVGQQEKGGPVQTPWVPEVHVLDAGLLFEPGLFQPAGELSVFTASRSTSIPRRSSKERPVISGWPGCIYRSPPAVRVCTDRRAG